ncbi:MAG: RES domain-containing protein [Chloroflexota bacterium]|nr:MAG: RES domain-containing protein [Chloroflexota bacterium]
MAANPWLLARLREAESGPYVGIAWRVTLGDRPVMQPNTRGARWNPPGTTALYASLTEACARAEMRFLIESQPVRPAAYLNSPGCCRDSIHWETARLIGAR